MTQFNQKDYKWVGNKAKFTLMSHNITKIHQMHDSDIFPLNIGIPDNYNLFATLIYTIKKLLDVQQEWKKQMIER